MSITGQQLIGGQWQAGRGAAYRAINPATAQPLAPELRYCDDSQLQAALTAAQEAAVEFAATTPEQRAVFLECCAEEIMALGSTLTERVCAETGYPMGRAEGERGRTCNQLRLFADHIRQGDYLDVRIDTAQPDRQPLPRPDIRFYKCPIGPVAVFGSSNFPLAFSVAGGDTASALAAGCPVIVKSHNAHPGTGELVAQAVARALHRCNLPGGVFSFVSGPGNDIGATLVTAPEIKAVGFTGSLRGGMALQALVNQRPDPIPCFTEMGSINPVIVMPQALAHSAQSIADNFVVSLTMGTGQFCVNPGLVLGIKGPQLETFIATAGRAIAALDAGVMLNAGVADGFSNGSTVLAQQKGVQLVAAGQDAAGADGFCGQAQLYRVPSAEFKTNPVLQEEVFGPCSLVVECADMNDLMAVCGQLKGQLSGTLQATEEELLQAPGLIQTLQARVGRLVVNNFPTGVEVCSAMMHGGPFPAASDSRFTSVGTAAIDRFVRPISYQNCPQSLLPSALRDDNPWQLNRLVDGQLHLFKQ